MKVAVLGAGLAGVTTAWELACDGHQVVVIDREPQVAAGASFANGGIVADLVSGRAPRIDLEGLRVRR